MKLEFTKEICEKLRKQKTLEGRISIMDFCAFRYAIGRKTYIVGWVCENIRVDIDKINDHHIHLMIKEIAEAIEEGHAGMKCDIETWTNLQHFLIKEQDKRNDNI